MKGKWWKYLCILLMLYTLAGGMLMPVPALDIVQESIRNLYYHVPMWFGMLIILLVSMVYSIMYLLGFDLKNDIIARNSAMMGTFFGILGLLTGMVWANYTWGAPWSNDPKQLVSAIGLLIYLSYFVLRASMDDPDQRAKVAGVYNIFAFFILVPLLFVVPRMTDSLHPGNGGNPGFNAYDLDNRMRMVFYPAVIAWTLLGVWVMSLKNRLDCLEYERQEWF